MSTVAIGAVRRGVFRHSAWDALLVGLALGQGALLVAWPSLLLVAVGLWWNSNTIAHVAIHTPLFRASWCNRLFALYESALLGIPQTVWRGRHLAHHAGAAWRMRLSTQLLAEATLVLAVWALLLWARPGFFLTAYLPGYLLGLGLCWLQGHYEHHRGTVSHHGRLYNLLFFNDGYHVEHHERPGLHWTRLPATMQTDAPSSPWPAVLRWLEWFSLTGLERLVVRCLALQRFVLSRHRAAFARLLPPLPDGAHVVIVGGGLFPRTLLVLRALLPGARFTVLDRDAEHLAVARRFVAEGVELIHAAYAPEGVAGADLVVFPLAFVGDRAAVYRSPPAAQVIVHDWLWRRRGRTEVVSWCLCKRLNLVCR
jgi:fatty acid desaturase